MATEIPPQKPQTDLATMLRGGSPAADPWLDSRFLLRPELRFDTRNEPAGTHVIIEDPVRGKFFQIGCGEYRFIASLKGNRTVREIVAQLAETHPGSIDDETAKTICLWLVNCNLVFSQEVDNAKRLENQANLISRQKLMGLMNPITIKVSLFNPNRLLTAMQPYCQWVFSRWFFAIWIITGLMALRVIYSQWAIIGHASVGILSGYRWFWLLVVWLGLKAIHETAHGIACRRYGGEVSDAGILLLLFTPLAFVNVTSSWRFPHRWHRIVVAAAGMYVELFVSCLAIISWSYLPEGILADVCFNVFFTASVTTVLFNANPLMRFDGYYILSDMINVPNLYTKGTKWFGDRLKSLVFGVPKTPNIFPPGEHRRVAIYGSMAFFWKLTVSCSLIIGASVLFYGAGIALAAIGVTLWFGLPIYRQLQQLFGPNPIHPVNWRRVAISFAVMTFLAVSMFTLLGGPATKSAPAIVQFKDEVRLRADANGFVKAIKIADGQEVQQGDELICLENPELELEIKQLEHRVEEATIQSRIYRQAGETALTQAEEDKRESLCDQLAEKQEQARGLVVRAPFDGFVFQRDLENRIGSFVHRGDEILTIAEKKTKEIVVSVDQSDLESIKFNEGELLRVAFPGKRVFQSQLVRIDPRADDRPTHPSLCANEGGPLPIRYASQHSNDSPAVRLLSPRFTAELDVNAEIGNELYSGQRGRVYFSAQRQSLGSYLYLLVSQWFQKKFEKATRSKAF
jgi:putative peptide zinc metalloprotease protein